MGEMAKAWLGHPRHQLEVPVALTAHRGSPLIRTRIQPSGTMGDSECCGVLGGSVTCGDCEHSHTHTHADTYNLVDPGSS